MLKLKTNPEFELSVRESRLAFGETEGFPTLPFSSEEAGGLEDPSVDTSETKEEDMEEKPRDFETEFSEMTGNPKTTAEKLIAEAGEKPELKQMLESSGKKIPISKMNQILVKIDPDIKEKLIMVAAKVEEILGNGHFKIVNDNDTFYYKIDKKISFGEIYTATDDNREFTKKLEGMMIYISGQGAGGEILPNSGRVKISIRESIDTAELQIQMHIDKSKILPSSNLEFEQAKEKAGQKSETTREKEILAAIPEDINRSLEGVPNVEIESVKVYKNFVLGGELELNVKFNGKFVSFKSRAELIKAPPAPYLHNEIRTRYPRKYNQLPA